MIKFIESIYQVMSDNYTLADAVSATVIDESGASVLVEFDDGSVESIDKNSVLGLLCQMNELEPGRPIIASGRALLTSVTIDRGGVGVPLTLHVDPTAMTGTLTVSPGGEFEDELTLTGGALAPFIVDIIKDAENSADPEDDDFDQTNLSVGRDTATKLYEHYQYVISTRVREELMEEILDELYFELEFTDDGVVVDDTHLVTWDGENYLVDDVTPYECSGSDVVEVSGSKQAIGIDFDTSPQMKVDIEGTEYVISETEQEFLATVEMLVHPSHYFGVDQFELELHGAVMNAKMGTSSQLNNIARSATVTHYVDPSTGLVHEHEFNKHVIVPTFDAKPWVALDLYYNSWDHAGVVEFAWREDEFRNADRPVFEDVDNDNEERWEKVRDRADRAPCPPEVYQRLRAMYGTSA